jgi:hypothetical protein
MKHGLFPEMKIVRIFKTWGKNLIEAYTPGYWMNRSGTERES